MQNGPGKIILALKKKTRFFRVSMLIDAHCHISSLSEEEKKRIFSCGSSKLFIDSSINLETAVSSSKFSSTYSFIYSALGFHPFYVRGFNPHILATYKDLIQNNKKIIAIGEIGLDVKADASLPEQENVFRIFLKLAKETGLAVIIHCRLKSPAVLNILDDFYGSYEKIILHCFSYTPDILERIMTKGGYVSFSLNILRKNKDILQSLRTCPLQNLLLETDSPYMKIEQRQSSPLDIEEVYKFAAFIKGIERQELEEAVLANAKRVFAGFLKKI
jgi:TatD DNase family protein